MIISPEEGTGSTIPAGRQAVKQGYPFEVSFSEAGGYSFVRWVAVSQSNPSSIIEAGVDFTDAYSPKTTAIVRILSMDIRIMPLCAERLAVTETTPVYSPTGVSRDRSITVLFSKTPSKSSFIFNRAEVPADATDIRTSAEGSEIWAYNHGGQTHLKNITITNADGISIAEHFGQPVLDGKLLLIPVDKTNPIEIESGANTKTIIVTVSGSVCDEGGVKMSAEKQWRYLVTEATDEKATISLVSEAAEGSVYLAGTRDYNIGHKITLAFTESADYQFVKWDYDPAIVYVTDPANVSTTAVVVEKTTESNPTQIKAVCEPRLRVSRFSPVNDAEHPSVSKNSSITITFSQDLPSDEEGKAQLKNISIAVGGSPVRSSFAEPVLSGSSVTFAVDRANMLDVPAGQTKTVTVSIPADFYYKTAGGDKVTYGGNGAVYDYKIDSSTLEKAEVNFAAPTNSGTISPERGVPKYYSIGEEVPVSFTVAEGWQFNGWSVTGIDGDIESKIKIADKNALSTKFTVYEAVTGVTVSASASECLKSELASPSSTVNPKDSAIVITFNKPLAPECAALLDRIRVSSDGIGIDSCYASRSLSEDRLSVTLSNTSYLSVPKGASKAISVTVPQDLYYMDGGAKISLAEKSFSFTVNHTTTAKAKITYSVLDGESGTQFIPATAAGSLTKSYEEYNIGEDADVSLSLTPGYQFSGWQITDAAGTPVTSEVSFRDSNSSSLEARLTVNAPADGIKVSAICYRRPSVSTATVSPYSADSAVEVAKNTPIVINFAHAIEYQAKDEILLSYSVSNFAKQLYFTTSISDDRKTVTLTPVMMLPLEHSYETMTVTIPHEKIYYLAADGRTKITMSDEDFTWSYRVNASTMTKTTLRIGSSDTTATASVDTITVNGSILSKGSTQPLNVEQSLSLEYPLPSGYQFSGWKLEAAAAGYIVEPSGYVTSGTISVKNGITTFCTLTVDSTNPTKAVLKSLEAVGSGVDGWGIAVAAKDTVLPRVSSVRGWVSNTLADISATTQSSCDSKLYINFTKPIDPLSVTLAPLNWLLSSVNITKYGYPNLHYEGYFTASWENEYKTLVLTPLGTINTLVPNTSDTFVFTITLNSNGLAIKDTEGCPLIAGDSITYTINGNRETNPPEFYGTQKLYDGTRTRLLSSDSFDGWSDTQYTQNHIKDSVCFDIQGYDTESGLSKLRVTETYQKTVSGENASGETHVKEYTNSDLVTTLANGAGVYRFSGTHNLQTLNDGLIKLEFQLVDNAGNVSVAKTYYVIKDTIIDESVVKFNENKATTYGQVGTALNDVIRRRRGNNDTVTLTLTELPKDVFYGTHSTNYDISVKWGYSKEDFPYDATKTTSSVKTTFSFTHNTYKDTFVKILVSDGAGNSRELIRVLPAQAVIQDHKKETSPYTTSDILKMTAANKAQYESLLGYYGATSFKTWAIFYEDNNRNLSWTKDNFTGTSSSVNLYSTVEYHNKGTGYGSTNLLFHVYLVTAFEYGSEYWLSSLSDAYVNAKYDNDYKFTTFELVSGASTGSLSASSYLVNNLKVTTEPVLNSGCFKVTVDDEFKSSVTSSTTGITYSVIAKKYNTTEQIESKDLTFYLPSPGKYELYLKAEDSSGKSVTSSTYCVLQVDGNSTDTHYLNFTKDLIPPSFHHNENTGHSFGNDTSAYWIEDSGSATTVNGVTVPDPLLSDNEGGVGLAENAEGLAVLDYYLIPNSNTNINAYNLYTLESLEQYSGLKKTLAFAPNAGRIQIPYDGADEGLYTMCLVIKDKNGNYLIKCGPAFNKRLGERGSYSQKDFYDPTVGQWIYRGHPDDTDWVRRGRSLKNAGTVSASGFYDVYFGIESPYGAYGVYLEEEIPTSSKNVMPGLNGLQILCDKNTLAHTLYCSKKLSSGTGESDIAIWENKAQETGVVMNTSNFTYGSENYKDIPSGYYYTTIVHFIDGTTVMTEVKQK